MAQKYVWEWHWPGYAHWISYYQLVENFDVYLHINQLHSSLLSWDIANILQTCHFRYFGHDWPRPPKLVKSPCRDVFVYLHAKINFNSPFFLEILQRYCELVILGALCMPSYGHKKRWYQLVENFDVNLHAKIHIYPSPFSWNIAKTL